MNEFKLLFNRYGISQRKAAKHLGISSGYLSDMLNGNRKALHTEELRTYLRKLSSEIVNVL